MRYLSDSTGITVIHDDEVFMVPSTDITYPQIRDYLVDQSGSDIDRLRELFTQTKDIIIEATADALSVVDGDANPDAAADEQPYRLIHGDPVSDVVLSAAIRVTDESGDPKAISAFLRRLEKNPSAASRSQLFAWLAAEGFTLTPDGMIIGYKGVSEDFRSLTFGHEPVTVTPAGGEPTVHSGHIPYPIGAEVSLPRELVNNNRDWACSVGLHVGTFSYARSFAGTSGSNRILLVLVDPADVVSVPRDADNQKVRVCRLVVAAEHTGDRIQQAVMTVPNAEAREEYQAREENQPTAKPEGLHVDTHDYTENFNSETVEITVTAPVAGSEPESSDEDEEAETEEPEEDSVDDGPQHVVAVAVIDRLKDGPQSKRTLGKRLSANRRVHLDVALDILVNDGSVVCEKNGKYRISSD